MEFLRVTMEMQDEYDDLCVALLNSKDEDVIQLIDAWVSGKDEPAKVLLARYQSVRPFKKTERFGATLLHMVCDLGFVKGFHHIMSLNSDPDFINKKMDDGSTALHLNNIHTRESKTTNNFIMTKQLVESGADCFAIRDLSSANALYLACESSNLQSAKFLLNKMLETLGITEGNASSPENIDALRQILVLPQVGSTVLHASVTLGNGDEVCRWLTSPECSFLWKGVPDFLGKTDRYNRTVLMEAWKATSIHVPTIRYLTSLYDPPISALTLLTSYLESILTSKPIRSPKVLHEAIEFLYEQASMRSDFNTLSDLYPPHSVHPFALKLIVKFFPGYDLSPPPVIPLLHRLIAKYPEQLNPRVLKEFSSIMFDQFRENHVVIRILAMMDLLPYTSGACEAIYNLRFVVGESMTVYIRNLKSSGKIDAPFLFDIMRLGDGSCDFWMQFLDCSKEFDQLSDSLETMILCRPGHSHGAKSKTAISLVCINHIRFLVWLHSRRFLGNHPSCRSDMIARTLSICKTPHRMVPTLLSRSILVIDDKTIRNFGLTLVHDLDFLRTIMWYSDVRPTQVCACLIGEAISYMGTRWFMHALTWIFTVRTMIRERREMSGFQYRMILGPKVIPGGPKVIPGGPKVLPKVFVLPTQASHLIVEFMWQGPSSFSPPPYC
jgi:hypothetical protein